MYKKSFKELINDFDRPISCYNCHENDPTQLKVTNTFYLASLGNDVDNYALRRLSSRRCVVSATTSIISIRRPRCRQIRTAALTP